MFFLIFIFYLFVASLLHFFYFVFLWKVLSIMSDKAINELFYYNAQS